MKINLSGKIAIVTGSTEGIGFAIAKGLAEAGAKVVVNGRTNAKVDASVKRLGGSARGGRRRPRHYRGARHARRRRTCGRHRRQQSRHLPAGRLLRHRRCDVGSALASERHGRRPPGPRLPARHGGEGLGPVSAAGVRIRLQHSGRDDPLRRQQDRRRGARPRARQAHGGHRRHGELSPARPDAVRRRDGDARGGSAPAPATRSRTWRRTSSPPTGPARSSAAPRASRRWRTWSSTLPRPRRRRRRARRCVSTAA